MDHIGVPLASEKTVFPTTSLECLGVLIDTVCLEFCLPKLKISKLQSSLSSLLDKHKATVWEVHPLLGLLAFASPIMFTGKIYSRRLAFLICGCAP